jgi:hypothetical protein
MCPFGDILLLQQSFVHLGKELHEYHPSTKNEVADVCDRSCRLYRTHAGSRTVNSSSTRTNTDNHKEDTNHSKEDNTSKDNKEEDRHQQSDHHQARQEDITV